MEVNITKKGLSEFLQLIEMPNRDAVEKFTEVAIKLLREGDIITVQAICESMQNESLYSEIASNIFEEEKELTKLFGLAPPSEHFLYFLEQLKDIIHETPDKENKKKIIRTVMSASKDRNKHVYSSLKRTYQDLLDDNHSCDECKGQAWIKYKMPLNDFSYMCRYKECPYCKATGLKKFQDVGKVGKPGCHGPYKYSQKAKR